MIWVWLLVALSTAGVLAAIWGIGIERHLFVIRRESVRVLPAGSQPIKVLHIGDLGIDVLLVDGRDRHAPEVLADLV